MQAWAKLFIFDVAWLMAIAKIISLITPNAYFRAFFKHLFVTCVLHIKPRLVSRCFIIS